MRAPGYAYRGIFLSELAATSRERIEVKCRPCDKSGSYRLATLIEQFGNVVLPHALGLISANCPRRKDARVMPGCSATFADPVTVAEEAAIVAGRGG